MPGFVCPRLVSSEYIQVNHVSATGGRNLREPPTGLAPLVRRDAPATTPDTSKNTRRLLGGVDDAQPPRIRGGLVTRL
jgi:hypothetical protein